MTEIIISVSLYFGALALLDEIMRIAAVHDRAERFIQNSIGK